MINTSSNNSNEFVFEKRPYLSDCGDLVKEALKKRISFYDDQIILYKEIPIMSPFSVDFLLTETSRKGSSLKNGYSLIVDVREVKRPDSASRRKINEIFKYMCEEIEHVSFCTGKSTLLNATAKFVMYQTNLRSFTFDSNIEESVTSIKKVMNG